MTKLKHFKLGLLALLMVVGGASAWGQETIAAWTFPTTSGDAPAVLAAECGALQASSSMYADGTNGSDNWKQAGRKYFTGNAVSPALCGVTTATGAYTLVNADSEYINPSVIYRNYFVSLQNENSRF